MRSARLRVLTSKVSLQSHLSQSMVMPDRANSQANIGKQVRSANQFAIKPQLADENT